MRGAANRGRCGFCVWGILLLLEARCTCGVCWTEFKVAFLYQEDAFVCVEGGIGRQHVCMDIQILLDIATAPQERCHPCQHVGCCIVTNRCSVGWMTACSYADSAMWLQLVRRWRLGSLEAPTEGNALFCHNYPVRALASSRAGSLVSGDSSGELAIWSLKEPVCRTADNPACP